MNRLWDIGLRICGALMLLLGLAYGIGTFSSLWIVYTGGSAQPLPTGQGLMYMVVLGLNVASVIIGFGILMLKKIAVYSAIPLSVLWVWLHLGNVSTGNPFGILICLFFAIVLFMGVSYAIQRRSSPS